jgi:protein gp37
MGETTAISWCDHTFNAWIGCTKTSPACDFCYAETMAKFRGWAEWGPGKPRQRTTAANWRKPLHWNDAAAKAGRRATVFCNSLADVFDAEVSKDWRRDLAKLIDATPSLDWLLLTKRANVAEKELPAMAPPNGNVRIGFTVENQPFADTRLPALRRLAHAGYKTFVSYEPALGPIDWEPWTSTGAIGWLISGGESGAHARPSHPDWFRAARDACQRAGVPYHHKQNGEWAPGECAEFPATRTEKVATLYGNEWDFSTLTPRASEETHVDDEPDVYRLGTKRSGARLDGREHREFPR